MVTPVILDTVGSQVTVATLASADIPDTADRECPVTLVIRECPVILDTLEFLDTLDIVDPVSPAIQVPVFQDTRDIAVLVDILVSLVTRG